MKVTFIGSGNVTEYLSERYAEMNQPVFQIAGRNRRTVASLAGKYNTPWAVKPEQLLEHQGLYILAVNDDEIANAFSIWYNGKGTWVHTSGSTDLKVFGKKPGSFGVLYPVLSLNRQSSFSHLFSIPYLVEASDHNTLSKLRLFVKKTKGEFWQADSEKRLKVHLAAVFLNNFIQHVGILSFRMIKELKLNPELFKPLATVTLLNVISDNREKLQTGPARRKDLKTIKKQMALLKNKPELKAIYQVITNSILKNYH